MSDKCEGCGDVVVPGRMCSCPYVLTPSSFAAPLGYPALPSGMTREECVEGLREGRDEWNALLKRDDPTHVRYPDYDALIDYIAAHGFPAPDNNRI